jgi:hypothetical protein
MERKGLSAIEIDLLERINEDDDTEAMERFIDRYQDLLHRFAHKYHSERLPYEDAYQLAASSPWTAPWGTARKRPHWASLSAHAIPPSRRLKRNWTSRKLWPACPRATTRSWTFA